MLGLNMSDSFNGIDVICCTCKGTYVEYLNARIALDIARTWDFKDLIFKKMKKKIRVKERSNSNSKNVRAMDNL